MNLPKFIITMDGYFRLGMVNQQICGDGAYSVNSTKTRFPALQF